MDREAKVWKCKHCGAAMGVVARNGSGIRQLLLYRWAVVTSPITLPLKGRGIAKELYGDWDGEGRREDEPDVMAVVEGYVADVRCSVCGRVRTWVPGPEAIRKMLNGKMG